MAKLAGVAPNVVTRFLRGERDITLSTADRIATALGLVLVRAAELPADRQGPDRRDYGAMTVWSIETSEGRRAVAIRPAGCPRPVRGDDRATTRRYRGPTGAHAAWATNTTTRTTGADP